MSGALARLCNEMMRRMIEDFMPKQVPFRYILADVWFASAENMIFIKHKKRKEFVMPLKSNRKVALSEQDKRQGRYVSVSSLDPDENVCLPIYLEQVPFALLLYRSVLTNEDGTTSVLHLVTSELTLDGSQMVALYHKRWSATCGKWAGKVEEYHKSIKSHAAFAKSPTKRPRTRSNHFFASLVAYVKLETYRVDLCLNHFALRHKVCQAALARAFEQLQSLKATCITVPIMDYHALTA